MSNKYIKHYSKKRNPNQFSGEYFEEGGWADFFTPDSVEVALNFYGKRLTKPVIKDDGTIDVESIANKTAPGLAYTTMRDFFSEVWDYSETQREAAKKNQHAWEYKVSVADKLGQARYWPDDLPKKWNKMSEAFPNVNLSLVLGVPPNSVADAYAQGAIFARLTSKIYKSQEFESLAQYLLNKAKTGSNSIKKPQFEVKLDDPVGTFKSFMNSDDVVNAMKDIHKQWRKTSAQTNVYPAWYNIIGQLSKDWTLASEINRRLELFAKPEEINFSRNIAEQSQSSLWDLLYVMRGPLIIGGLGIAGVFLFPVISPLLPTIGRGVVSAGRGVGRLTANAAKSLYGAASNKIEDAVKQGIINTNEIETLVSRQLKAENPNVSEEDIRKIIRQQLTQLS